MERTKGAGLFSGYDGGVRGEKGRLEVRLVMMIFEEVVAVILVLR